MPSAKKKTTKSAETKTAKPRAKKSTGKITVKRTRVKSAQVSEHVLDLGDHVPELPPLETTSIWAMDPYGDEPETAPEKPASLYDDPVVRETINDKVGDTGRWPFAVYKRIAITFIVLSLLSLAAVAYVSLIRLDITVTPKEQAVEAATEFKVYDRPETYSLPEGSALGLVRNMDVEVEKSAPATGKKATGAEVSGTVTIINNYTKDQPLVASTRLLTPNSQILRLKDSVVVPAGGEIEVDVYAAEVDPSFTLADARLTIPGLWAGLQDKIYAEAKRGAVTYKESGQGIVTQADIDEAARLGRAALLEKAKTDIDSAYSAYTQKLYRLDDSSMTVTPANKIGDESAQATVKVSGVVAVVAFNETSIKGIADSALNAAAPQDNTVAGAKPNYELVGVDTQDNVAEVKATSSGMATPKTDAEILDRSKLVLLTRSQLEAYLKARPDIESYELRFTPSFWPLTPQLADHIHVTINQ